MNASRSGGGGCGVECKQDFLLAQEMRWEEGSSWAPKNLSSTLDWLNECLLVAVCSVGSKDRRESWGVEIPWRNYTSHCCLLLIAECLLWVFFPLGE